MSTSFFQAGRGASPEVTAMVIRDGRACFVPKSVTCPIIVRTARSTFRHRRLRKRARSRRKGTAIFGRRLCPVNESPQSASIAAKQEHFLLWLASELQVSMRSHRCPHRADRGFQTYSAEEPVALRFSGYRCSNG